MVAKTNKEKVDFYINLYQDGYSATFISKNYNISIGVITRELDKRKILVRNRVYNYTKQFEKEIIEMHKDGYLIKDIANKFNFDQSCIGRLLRKKNLKTNNWLSTIKSQEITSLYEDGYSLNEISKIFNINPVTVYKHCLKQCKNIRPVGSKLPIDNISFFDNLNEKSAYILGIFIADGCLKPPNIISFGLHIKDIYMVEKFKHLIGLHNKITIYKNMASITVKDNYLYESITQYKLPKSRKTYNLDGCNYLFNKLNNSNTTNHFIRGFLDGDGSIYYNKTYYHKLSFSGYSREFLDSINKQICTTLSINTGYFHKRNNSNTYSLSFSGRKRILKICNWIYNNASICLDRKKEKWLLIKNSY